MHRAAACLLGGVALLVVATLVPNAPTAAPELARSPAAASPAPLATGVAVAASFLDRGGSWNCGRGSETVNLFANATGGTPPYTYVWDFGDLTPASDAADPVHTYEGVGPFSASVRVVDHAGSYANASVAVAWPIPAACVASSPSPLGALLYAALLASVGGGGYLVVRWLRTRGS